MEHAETYTQRRGRRKTSEEPIGLLVALIKEKPEAGEQGHRREFRQLVLSSGYEDFLDAVISNWLTLHYRSAHRAAFPPAVAEIKERAEKRRALRAEEDVAVEAMKLQIIDNLLEMTMPNSKPLSDCTGAECLAFGGWLQKVGERVGLTKTVGEVLTAGQLRDILAR